MRSYLGLVAGSSGVFVVTMALALSTISVLPGLLPRWGTTVVGSGSMTPALRPGDVVAYREVDPRRVGVGTVVVFTSDDGRGSTVHRIAEVRRPGVFVTRGDANAVPDTSLVTPDRLRGAGSLVVPWAGLPRLWFAERRWVPTVLLAAALLLAFAMVRITSRSVSAPLAPVRLTAHETWLGRVSPPAPTTLLSSSERARVIARARGVR